MVFQLPCTGIFLMFLILSLIIIVAAFNIISGLTILIKNKTKEIAILKTLGLNNTSIKKSFFLSGFTIGFFATISGVILGIFILDEIISLNQLIGFSLIIFVGISQNIYDSKIKSI